MANKYEVTLPNGSASHEADFAFTDDRNGNLVLRKGQKGSTTVVAIYAPGEWKHVKLVADDSQNATVRTDDTDSALRQG